VRNLLPDLDQGLPGIFGSEFCAIGALAVLHQILDLECLLQDRIRENLHKIKNIFMGEVRAHAPLFESSSTPVVVSNGVLSR